MAAVQLFGASVRGPRNQREGQPNQDAWLRAQGTFGDLIVVCDGLGSRPMSDIGAKAACAAVRRAASMWPGIASRAEPRHLIRLVEILWRLALAPRQPSDCATTCSFALRERDGHLLLAGIGDGLMVLRHADGSVDTYGARPVGDFGNETVAMGISQQISNWWLRTESPAAGRVVMAATDGVADDLVPERLGDLITWLVAELAPLAPERRRRRLGRELHNWPVPHHVDDKTIAVLIECAEAEQS